MLARRSVLLAVMLASLCAAGFARAQGAWAVDAAFDELSAGRAPQVPVRLLSANADSWRARWSLVSQAQRTIDWTCFEVGDDAIGSSFLGLLARKARQGVTVRVLIDAKGSGELVRSRVGLRWLKVLASAGKVSVKLFNPIVSSLSNGLGDVRAIVACDHQKLLIVDGESVILGGRNTARSYLSPPEDRPEAWRDMDVATGGPMAGAAQAVFERAFDSAAAKPLTASAAQVEKADVDELEAAAAAMDGYLSSGSTEGVSQALPEGFGEELFAYAHLASSLAQPLPGPAVSCPAFMISKSARAPTHVDGLTAHLRKLLAAAQREIIITSPYVVLSTEARQVFKDAAARGVQIVLYTNSPETTNQLASQVPLVRDWAEILHESPTLRIFARRGPSMLHGKVFSIDRRVCAIGSYNMDSLSEQVNAEDALVMRSPEMAAELARQVGEDLKTASEYRIEATGDGKYRPLFGPYDACPMEVRRKLESYRLVGLGYLQSVF